MAFHVQKIYEIIVYKTILSSTLLNNLINNFSRRWYLQEELILTFIENRERLGGLKPVVGRIFCVARLDNMKGVGVTRLLGLVWFRAVNSLTVDCNECSYEKINTLRITSNCNLRSYLLEQDKRWNSTAGKLAQGGHRSANHLSPCRGFWCIDDESHFYVSLWWTSSIRFQG